MKDCEQETNKLDQILESYKKKKKDAETKRMELEAELKAAREGLEKELKRAKSFDPRPETTR